VKVAVVDAETLNASMINYTEQVRLLMTDIVARVPRLSFLDMNRILVFARSGRADREGPYATCHCICLPQSDPGYYFWRDQGTGALTRRSEWFVTKSPVVRVGTRQIDYMVSFTLPRFCDHRRISARKRARYYGHPEWMAKLDTIIHELYHIDPHRPGIRRIDRADGTPSSKCHSPAFFQDVMEMVTQYLTSSPDPAMLEFLRYDFAGLTTRYGGVVATTFKASSYPRRYIEVLSPQPDGPSHNCPVEPLELPRAMTHFTEDDLITRRFWADTARALSRKGKVRAA
jgi:hypothetical protein